MESPDAREARRSHHAVDDLVAVDYIVEHGHRANGLTLAEIRLPSDAVVTAVERDGVVLVPRGRLRLLTGDRVRVMTSAEVGPEVARMFATARPRKSR